MNMHSEYPNVSPEDKEFDQHVSHIQERVKERLLGLGLEAQLPSSGVMRIIQEISLAYWAEDEAQEMDASTITIVKKVARGMPVQGFILAAEDERGDATPLGFVSTEDEALYVTGHKITVGVDGRQSAGKVNSMHSDGSLCNLPCKVCDDGNVHVDTDGDEYLAVCQNCHAETDCYEDKWLALAAWMAGKVKTSEEVRDEEFSLDDDEIGY